MTFELPETPDDDSDFTPDLARRIIGLYQQEIERLHAENEGIRKKAVSWAWVKACYMLDIDEDPRQLPFGQIFTDMEEELPKSHSTSRTENAEASQSGTPNGACEHDWSGKRVNIHWMPGKSRTCAKCGMSEHYFNSDNPF